MARRQLTFAQIVATPAGRAFLLKQIANAEAIDASGRTAGHFDRILTQVTEPTLRRKVERHRDDEVRHLGLYNAMIERTGVDPGPVPDRVHEEFDEALGFPLSRPITDRRGVFEAYLALKLMEERNLEQLPEIELAIRAIDPFTAETIRAVVKDEERHVLYCNSVIEAYAPSEHEMQATLERFGELGRQCWMKHGVTSLRFMLDNGIVQLDA